MPPSVDIKQVDVWFEDEARIGQQNTLTRIWAKTGTRPRVVRQQQFISTHLFGAVCPKTGQTAGLVMPNANTTAMQMHLNHISQQVPQGRHAVVVMDRASWHTTMKLPAISNITRIFLPPASPELNPVEQVWKQLREDTLANRCFKDYDTIVDAACLAWNQFTQHSDQVKSLCQRSWVIL